MKPLLDRLFNLHLCNMDLFLYEIIVINSGKPVFLIPHPTSPSAAAAFPSCSFSGVHLF